MNSRNIIKFLILLMLLGFNSVFGIYTHAQEFAITVNNSPQFEYQPFSGLAASESLRLTLDPLSRATGDDDAPRASGPSRPVQVRIREVGGRALQAMSSEQGVLPITLALNSRGARLRLINNEYQHTFNLNENLQEPISLDYLVNIPASIFAAAGTYKLGLEVELIDFSSRLPIAAVQAIELLVQVEPRLQVNIAGTNKSSGSANLSTVDFGVLKTSQTRQLFVQVRGNAPAIIGVSSENNGRLILQDETNRNFINYSISIDGVSSTLKSPLVLRRPAALNLRGSSYPMTIKVGDVDGAFAGQYKDVVTVEVRPQ